MTVNANPKLFNIRYGLVVGNVKRNVVRLRRTAQPSDDAWRWKAWWCICLLQENCSRHPVQPVLELQGGLSEPGPLSLTVGPLSSCKKNGVGGGLVLAPLVGVSIMWHN